MTEHPIFALENVVVTPHLGASTTEAQDRAGVITAEQVVAALTGGLVTNAVNIPTVRGEDLAVLEPYMPLATQLGRLAMSLAARTSVDRIEVAYLGRLADFDTRLVTLSVLNGALAGRIEENVNLVNASSIAEERGIAVSETQGERVTRLREPAVGRGRRRRRARRGRRHDVRPAPRAPPRRRLRPELQHRARAAHGDLPLLGRAGDDRQDRHGARRARHQHRLDGRRARARPRARRPAGGGSGRLAVMVVTTDSPVPDEVIERDRLARRLPGRARGHALARDGQSRRDRARPLLRLEDRGDADRCRARGDGRLERDAAARATPRS